MPSRSINQITVLGDLMLDQYFEGKSTRMSPEGPFPIILNPNTRYFLGGGANLAHTLSSLGIEVELFGVIGADSAGERLSDLLSFSSISNRSVSFEGNTVTKSRYFSNGHQVLRVDGEDLSHKPAATLSRLSESLKESKFLVICDYGKHVSASVREAISIAIELEVPVLADPKGYDLSLYSGTFILKPNLSEFSKLFSCKITQHEEVLAQLESHNIRHMLVTRGGDDAILFDTDKNSVSKIGIGRQSEIFDVTGAGDVALGCFAAIYEIGDDLAVAWRRSLESASQSLSEIGPNITLNAAASALKHRNISDNSKLRILGKLARQKGARIAFANGCFDILHAGHVNLLRKASEHAEFLVVGLNSDDSVRKIKGEGRPVIGAMHRKSVLESLNFVSWVSIFSQDTPIQLITDLRPDFIVKGDDYKAEQVVGFSESVEWGGEIVILPREIELSTTSIVNGDWANEKRPK